MNLPLPVLARSWSAPDIARHSRLAARPRLMGSSIDHWIHGAPGDRANQVAIALRETAASGWDSRGAG